MPTGHEVQKILSGNRITLPKPFIEEAKLKKGDLMIVEWGKDEVHLKIAEVAPRHTAQSE